MASCRVLSEGPAVPIVDGSPAPRPARALTRRDAKDARPSAAQHVGDALAEVVREGALLEGRQAVGDYMPHPHQMPKLAAHGRGGACRTEGGKALGSGRGHAAPNPRLSPALLIPPSLDGAPTPPGHRDRTTGPHSRTEVTSPSAARNPPASVHHFR